MELRKDYVLDRWVFLSPGRKARPKELQKGLPSVEKSCFFCPENEGLTPAEIGRLERNGKWSVRWFGNKFPAVVEEGNAEVKTDNTFFTYSAPFGRHEIVVDTPNHDEQLWDLGKERVADVFRVCIGRISGLMSLPKTEFVSVFKNHGAEGGASLVHSHIQVASVAILPPLVHEEVSSAKKFGSCPYCRIIEVESKSLRRCFENSSFVAFAPYASRFNYEVWVFPKRHVDDFRKLDDREVIDLAGIMTSILGRLRSICASYNFFFHYSEVGRLHAHIEVAPRLSVWAGFEFSTGCVINSVMPEDAATFYRGE